MYKRQGYEQPPAAAYQTGWSAEVCCPKGQNDMEVLGRLFLDFNEHLPEDYKMCIRDSKTALKIYQYFGPTSVEILEKSPFELCQISGFGFRRVDAIVQKPHA